MSSPIRKNWRNGQEDVAPPLVHRDMRPCTTIIGFAGVAVAICPGPVMIPVHSRYTAQEKTS